MAGASGGEEMSEWQPAVIKISHELHDARNVVLNGKVIRVREVDSTLTQRFEEGCTQDRKFILHPTDVARYAPWVTTELGICEHEILTD